MIIRWYTQIYVRDTLYLVYVPQKLYRVHTVLFNQQVRVYWSLALSFNTYTSVATYGKFACT